MQFMTINMLGFLPKLIQNINIVYFKESYWNGIGILVYPFFNLNSRLLSLTNDIVKYESDTLCLIQV